MSYQTFEVKPIGGALGAATRSYGSSCSARSTNFW